MSEQASASSASLGSTASDLGAQVRRPGANSTPVSKTRTAISSYSIEILRRLVRPSTLPFLSSYFIESFDMPLEAADCDGCEVNRILDSFFPEHGNVECGIPTRQKRKLPFAVRFPLEGNTRIESESLINMNKLPDQSSVPSTVQIKRPSASELKRKSLDSILSANDGPCGTIVYNSISSSGEDSSGDLESLKFDSRFESGNLVRPHILIIRR
jgi:hypothetical protein